MTAFLLAAATFLLLTIALGLYRVIKGPDAVDRIMAVQLSATAGLAITLLLGAALEEPAATDMALVFALLAALAVTAFVRCFDASAESDGAHHPHD